MKSWFSNSSLIMGRIPACGGRGAVVDAKLTDFDSIKRTLEGLSKEYDSILNWDDPASGFVWTSEQIENFRMRAQRAYGDLVSELGEEDQIQNSIDLSLGIVDPS